MNGETSVAQDHAHTWEAVEIDKELYGKTNLIEGHFHEISIPVTKCFAEDVSLETSTIEGHSHEVVIPADLLTHLRGKNGEKKAFAKPASLAEDEDDPNGPDGSDEEEDEKKRRKKKIDDDGLEVMADKKKFQGKMTDKPWVGDRSRFDIDQLRRSVPAAMRAWGDAQAKGKDAPSKGDYKLPYKEPDGTVNVNGVRNALSRAKSVKGPPPATIAKAVTELQGVLASAKKAGFAEKPEDEKDKECFSAGMLGFELPPNGEIRGNRVIIRGVKVFRTGEWNGTDVTDQTLMELNTNFHALKNSFEPPLKAGHDMKVHKAHFGEPGFGHVVDARVMLPYWENDFSFPIDTYRDYIDPEKLKARSIEVQQNFTRNGRNYGLVMTAVALLGVSNPAVGDLGPIKMPFSIKEEDLLIFEFNDDGGEHVPNKDKEKDKENEANNQEFETKVKEQAGDSDHQFRGQDQGVRGPGQEGQRGEAVPTRAASGSGGQGVLGQPQGRRQIAAQGRRGFRGHLPHAEQRDDAQVRGRGRQDREQEPTRCLQATLREHEAASQSRQGHREGDRRREDRRYSQSRRDQSDRSREDRQGRAVR
jgi:hypothetical protein